MRSNTLLTAVGVVLLAAALWFVKSANDVKKNLVPVVQQVDIPATPAVTAATPASGPEALSASPTPSPEAAQAAEIRELQRRLATEELRLESQRRALEELQNRRAAEAPREVYSSQIDTRQDQVENLVETLEDARFRETRLNETARQSLLAQDTSSREARAALDENIRVQQEILTHMQNELTNLQASLFGAPPPPRMLELQAQIPEQQARVDALRDEKNALAMGTVQQTNQLQSLTAQAREELIGTQESLQTQISTLREDIRRLQNAEAESRMSVMSLSSQISQAQKDFEAQNQEVQNLQSELQRRQQTATTVE